MTNQQPTELFQPSVGPLHDPAPTIAPELATVLVPPRLVVLPIRHDPLDATPTQSLAEGIGVVAPIGNHALRFLPRAALRSRDTDLGERGFRKRNFTGEALSNRTPSGRPLPSPSTIHF